jgi:AraC family transcriptional activator of pobA
MLHVIEVRQDNGMDWYEEQDGIGAPSGADAEARPAAAAGAGGVTPARAAAMAGNAAAGTDSGTTAGAASLAGIVAAHGAGSVTPSRAAADGTAFGAEARSRDCWYLSLVTYGKCVYWIEQEKVVMEKGDLLLIPGSTYFYGKSVPTLFHSKTVVKFIVSADGAARLPLLGLAGALKWKLGRYEQALERVQALHREWSERQPYADVMAEAMLMELLTICNRERDRGVVSDHKHRYVEHMKKYVQEHYREKVTKDDLGAYVRLSPNYAATLFREVTGQTISEYVHGVRIKTALHLLVDSRLTVAEISEFLGYGDVSYFHRVFKRLTGRNPSEWMAERPADI